MGLLVPGWPNHSIPKFRSAADLFLYRKCPPCLLRGPTGCDPSKISLVGHWNIEPPSGILPIVPHLRLEIREICHIRDRIYPDGIGSSTSYEGSVKVKKSNSDSWALGTWTCGAAL